MFHIFSLKTHDLCQDRCSALPIELSSELGTGHFLARLECLRQKFGTRVYNRTSHGKTVVPNGVITWFIVAFSDETRRYRSFCGRNSALGPTSFPGFFSCKSGGAGNKRKKRKEKKKGKKEKKV